MKKKPSSPVPVRSNTPATRNSRSVFSLKNRSPGARLLGVRRLGPHEDLVRCSRQTRAR